MSSNTPTIIFDYGGVLIDWNPHLLFGQYFPDSRAVDAFMEEIGFDQWNHDHDCGRPFKESIAELAGRFPHHRAAIWSYYERFEETLAGTIEPVVRILHDLKRSGYPLYGLSNWSAETFARIRGSYPFFELLDGMVLSGEVGMVKPDPAIFELTLERIGRPASECVFVDDRLANVQAARSLGIRAIHYQDPAQLVAELKAAGVPVDPQGGS